MIQQLRVNVFDVDLYNAIEEDANFGIDIRKLLQPINKQNIHDSLVQILFNFEAFFNHICWDIQLKKTYDAQIQQNNGEVDEKLDLSATFKTQVNVLKPKFQEQQDKMTSFDNQILNYRSQISKLNKKIADMEKKKVEFRKSKSTFTREKIGQ